MPISRCPKVLLTVRQLSARAVATRGPQGPRLHHLSGTVAPSVDQKNGPHDLGQVVGAAANGPCSGGPRPAEPTKVADVDQGTRTRPQTHSTPPWGQRRMRAGCPFGGVFVLPATAPRRTSGAEGVGMT
jgi:hypothetical protein